MSFLYRYTNENLEGINKGLIAQGHVLSVLGSGDQAFSFLEGAEKVTAVDISYSQLKYAERRIKLLQSERYEGFLNSEDNPDYSMPGMHETRTEYLRQRLEIMRKNIHKLNLKQGDITEQKYDNIDRIYFSNSLDTELLYMKHEKTIAMFDRLFVELKNGSIIYITDFLREIENGFHYPSDSLNGIKNLGEFFLELLDSEKSASGNRIYYRWIPKIYLRK